MDKLEEIKKLKQLLDEGVIDEIDFMEWVNDYFSYDKKDIIEILNKHYSDKPYFKALMFYVENSVSDYPSSN